MNKATLLNIIRQGEKLDIEFKSNFNIQVIETLVAFANAKGGKIYIGITDNRQIDNNFIVNQETIPNWLNEIKTKTQPSLIPDIEIIEIENKQIIEISIKEFPIKPVSCKGKYFRRVNNSNHQLSLSEISLMHLKTFNTSWDNYPANNYSIDDISEKKIHQFIEKVNQSNDFKIEDNPFVVLHKFELLQNDRITNACHLLFSKNDVFTATIELGRFSDAISIKDGLTVRSDLFSQVNEVITFIKKHINKEYIITGEPQREERWQYPMTAIREIVVNMIVHRDYTHYGSSSIKIFNDRIEFYNPGKLPDNITIDKIFSGEYVSEIRNLKIANLFKEIKLIEKYGSGFSRIIKAFKAIKLQIPVFENFQSGFRTVVYAEKLNVPDNDTDVIDNVPDDDTNVIDNVPDVPDNIFDVPDNVPDVPDNVTEQRLKIIVELISQNSKILLNEIADKLKVSKRTIRRDIEKLKIQNKIIRIGSEKSGHWQIIE
jgi:ATP-dependent DNA helicase RecG